MCCNGGLLCNDDGQEAIYQTLPLGSKSSIFDQMWSIYLIWRFHFHLKYKEKRAALDLLCKQKHFSMSCYSSKWGIEGHREMFLFKDSWSTLKKGGSKGPCGIKSPFYPNYKWHGANPWPWTWSHFRFCVFSIRLIPLAVSPFCSFSTNWWNPAKTSQIQGKKWANAGKSESA